MILRRVSSDRINIKKFYKTVSVKKGYLGYQIFLDNFSLKTPSGTPIWLPSETLALAVATEWATQTMHIKQFAMPLVLFK